MLKYSITCSAGVSTLLIAFVKWVDLAGKNVSGSPIPLVSWIYDNRVGLGFVFLTAQSACIVVLAVLKWSWFRPLDRDKIERVLEQELQRCFAKRDTEKFAYRATLFKRRWFPGIGYWLGSVARSGENHRRMTTIFSIDYNQKLGNSGIAGECFHSNAPIVKNFEPIEFDDDSDQAVANWDKYRKDSFLTAEELKGLALHSCVFMAVPIRVHNKTWGVLVLDSTDPNVGRAKSVTKNERTASLRTAAVYLGAMLE